MSERRFPPLPGETPQEWSARVLAAFAQLGTPKPLPPKPEEAGVQAPRLCIYCGRRLRRAGHACHAHSGLLAVDPVFSPDIPQKQEPAEDFRREALLDRLQPKAG